VLRRRSEHPPGASLRRSLRQARAELYDLPLSSLSSRYFIVNGNLVVPSLRYRPCYDSITICSITREQTLSTSEHRQSYGGIIAWKRVWGMIGHLIGQMPKCDHNRNHFPCSKFALRNQRNVQSSAAPLPTKDQRLCLQTHLVIMSATLFQRLRLILSLAVIPQLKQLEVRVRGAPGV
jgi:hypothetical protein